MDLPIFLPWGPPSLNPAPVTAKYLPGYLQIKLKMPTETTVRLHVKYRLFLLDFNPKGNVRQILVQLLNFKFH
jgi:hypothetical protein